MAKILIVDDDIPLLEAMSLLFSQEGYEVESCSNPCDVKHIMQTFSPDLIVLDVFLGNLDGRSVCKEMKQIRLDHDVHILMFSAGNVDEETVSQCGADEFIRKPFDINYLLGRVRSHLEQMHAA